MNEITTYWTLVEKLKQEIKGSRLQAVIAANSQMLQLYWRIGRAILDQQQQESWGTRVIDRLADDLKKEFPDMKGISSRNLKYMRAFADAWPDFVQESLAQSNEDIKPQEGSLIVQAPLAQIPWYHHITILDKVKDAQERLFYIVKTAENGWSRNVLVHQIESQLYVRQGKLQHNFPRTLPASKSDLARELFKDPYKFDFFQLTSEAQERDLENALTDHITKFLLEMGKGFAFVGRQVHLEKEGKDYYMDLLLYHLKLHCFVVIELKIGEFKPEYAGKLNFYLSLVDEEIKSAEDKPSIGLILCKSKNKVTVEYTLRDVNKPMGVAEYHLTEAIPQELKGELPTIEDLEQELEKEIALAEKPLHQKLNQLKEALMLLNREEVQKARDNESIIHLFDQVLPILAAKIEENLHEVTPLFNSIWLAKRVNSTVRADYPSVDLEALLQKENVRLIGLNLRLEGFKKAGVRAFNIDKELIFTLEQYKYIAGPQRDKAWVEKLYHQEWKENELKDLADKWCEELVEEIMQQLKNLE